MDSPCCEEDNTIVPNKVPNKRDDCFECCECGGRGHYIYYDNAEKSDCPTCYHRNEDCCKVVDSGIAEETSHSTQAEERSIKTNTNEGDVETNEDEKEETSNNVAQSSPVTLTPTSPTSMPDIVPLIGEAVARFAGLAGGVFNTGEIIEMTRERSVVERGHIHTDSPGQFDEFSAEPAPEHLSSDLPQRFNEIFDTLSLDPSSSFDAQLQQSVQSPVDYPQTETYRKRFPSPVQEVEERSDSLPYESESEEQKGQLEPIEQPQDQQKPDAGTIHRSKGVIPSSHAFKEFIRNLVDEVDPLFKHKIWRLAHWYLVKHADPDIQADLLELISELAYSDPVTIHIYNEDSISWVDKIGNLLDGYSKDEWDWWPLATPKQRLMPGYSRLDWKCVSTKVMYPNVRF